MLKWLKITKKGKKRIWENKAYSRSEALEFDARFWKDAGPQARFAAAWQMVGDFFKLRGAHANELRLRRSVQNIQWIRD